jgi:hypothetical protein
VKLPSQTVRARVTPALAVVGLLASCSRTPLPCRSPEHCPQQSECLANRCVALGSDPVMAGTTRLVVEAAQVAVVREGARGAISRALPLTVTLGGPEQAEEQLLVRFPRSWAGLDIDTAFLLLAPATSADPTGSDVQVQVALAAGPWAPGTLNEPPPWRSPASAGIARTRPPNLLRVDVTGQLKVLQGQPASDHGLLVRAEGATGAAGASPQRGATYLTGADGELPRLDVYFRLH